MRNEWGGMRDEGRVHLTTHLAVSFSNSSMVTKPCSFLSAAAAASAAASAFAFASFSSAVIVSVVSTASARAVSRVAAVATGSSHCTSPRLL